jgi:hypothetical protein
MIMSKVKSPSEKKRISLVKDRRNVYGECPTSSRKNIRRGKQRSHMEVRRAANEELRALKGTSVEADADAIESRAKVRTLVLARSSFKKVPDAPLGVVVARKLRRRIDHATGRKSR